MGLNSVNPSRTLHNPKFSFFLTKFGLVRSCVSTIRPGDKVYVALGSKYPFVLRPDGDYFLLRGFAYVHGIMHGERAGSGEQVLRIY
jgi:hypothetical protein